MADRYILIDRHLSEGGGGYMDKDTDGEWVRYSDLAAARAEIERLTFALAEVEALELQHGAVIARLIKERDHYGREKVREGMRRAAELVSHSAYGTAYWAILAAMEKEGGE